MPNAATLRSALDQIGDGIVLVDQDLRAVFMNRAFRRLWRVDDAIADLKPSLGDIFRHGCANGCPHVPAHEIDAFVADRVAAVKRGMIPSSDMICADGTILRFSCTAMADGGRMLTYADVTQRTRAEERLRHMVFHDHLTGVLNRRGFMEAGEREAARALRQGSVLSVAILDADHFKHINDTHGHDIGDKVLVEIALTCRAAARTSDAVGRIGGEEFALVLPDTRLDGGLILAERLRLRIEEPRTGLPHFTASLGVAGGNPGDRFEDLMNRADSALYRAKREGRNRVCAAP